MAPKTCALCSRGHFSRVQRLKAGFQTLRNAHRAIQTSRPRFRSRRLRPLPVRCASPRPTSCRWTELPVKLGAVPAGRDGSYANISTCIALDHFLAPKLTTRIECYVVVVVLVDVMSTTVTLISACWMSATLRCYSEILLRKQHGIRLVLRQYLSVGCCDAFWRQK